jgi:hypothetical protein
MPILTGALHRDGPAAVEVEIAVPAALARFFLARGQSVPAAARVPALIDTGADVSCIDPSVRHALGLTPSRTTRVVTPRSGPVPLTRRSYRVDLTVLHTSGHPPNNLVRTRLLVVEAVIGHTGYGMLLGCDVLGQCLLIRDGPSGHFSLAY